MNGATSGVNGKHDTDWEDGRMAGVTCDRVHVGSITADEQGEPWICDRCGAQLRLVWDVHLEEVPREPAEKK